MLGLHSPNLIAEDLVTSLNASNTLWTMARYHIWHLGRPYHDVNDALPNVQTLLRQTQSLRRAKQMTKIPHPKPATTSTRTYKPVRESSDSEEEFGADQRDSDFVASASASSAIRPSQSQYSPTPVGFWTTEYTDAYDNVHPKGSSKNVTTLSQVKAKEAENFEKSMTAKIKISAMESLRNSIVSDSNLTVGSEGGAGTLSKSCLADVILQQGIPRELRQTGSSIRDKIVGLSWSIASDALEDSIWQDPRYECNQVAEFMLAKIRKGLPSYAAELHARLADSLLLTQLEKVGSLLNFTRLDWYSIEELVRLWTHYNLISRASDAIMNKMDRPVELRVGHIVVLCSVRRGEDAEQGLNNMRKCLEELIADGMRVLDFTTPLDENLMKAAGEALMDEESPYGTYLRQFAVNRLKRSSGINKTSGGRLRTDYVPSGDEDDDYDFV